MKEVITVDGSILEGGGQIVRNVCLLAAALKQPVKVFNIRHRRSSPGLKRQHQHGIKALEMLGLFKVEGNDVCLLGSCEITVRPHEFPVPPPPTITIETGTAAWMTVTGGTNASFAPFWDYFHEVHLQQVSRFAIAGLSEAIISAELKSRGFFPTGGGKVVLTHPEQTHERPIFHPTNITDPGTVLSAVIRTIVTTKLNEDLQRKAHQEMSKAARSVLVSKFKDISNGLTMIYYLVSWSDSGHMAANEAADDALSGATFDRNATDQILIIMALAAGKSTIRAPKPLTLHTESVIEVMKEVAKVEVTRTELDTCVELSCTGLGLCPPSI